MEAGFFVYTVVILTLLWWTRFGLSFRKCTNLYFDFYKILPIIVFVVVVGFRYDVGGDFQEYSYYYNSQKDLHWSQVPYEYGFYLLIDFLIALELPAQSVFILCAFVQVLLLLKLLESCGESAAWIILFYFLTLSFIESLNVMRQGIAVLCFIVFVFNYCKYRYIIGFCYLLFGLAFHISILIPAIVYFFAKNFDFKRVWYLCVAVLIITHAFPIVIFNMIFDGLSIFLSDYSSYFNINNEYLFLESKSAAGVAKYLSLFSDIFIIYSFCQVLKLERTQSYKTVSSTFNLFVVGTILYPIVAETGFITLQRIMMYFYGVKFIVLGYVVKAYIEYRYGLLNFSISITFVFLYFLWFFSALYQGAAHSTPYYFYDIL
ncbi:EpsG family protein [Aeromonas caviae]